jgi:cell division protein FtsL
MLQFENCPFGTVSATQHNTRRMVAKKQMHKNTTFTTVKMHAWKQLRIRASTLTVHRSVRAPHWHQLSQQRCQQAAPMAYPSATQHNTTHVT